MYCFPIGRTPGNKFPSLAAPPQPPFMCGWMAGPYRTCCCCCCCCCGENTSWSIRGERRCCKLQLLIPVGDSRLWLKFPSPPSPTKEWRRETALLSPMGDSRVWSRAWPSLLWEGWYGRLLGLWFMSGERRQFMLLPGEWRTGGETAATGWWGSGGLPYPLSVSPG